jgi:hypothetical protein
MKIFFIMLCLGLSACVTEKKEPESVFLKPEVDPSGIVASKVTVHCHVQAPGKTKKVDCAHTSVKVTNLVAKTFITETFKGGSALVNFGKDVYVVEVTTSNCSTVRTFNGLMAGMVIDAYFDPPCGLK